MPKISKTRSIFELKCPSCREGDLYDSSSFSFKLSSFDMKIHCPKCGCNMYPEPGFYYGSMFISYIITGFFSVFLTAFLHWTLGLDIYTSFGILILVLSINFIWIYRFSRSLWAHFQIDYGTHKAKMN